MTRATDTAGTPDPLAHKTPGPPAMKPAAPRFVIRHRTTKYYLNQHPMGHTPAQPFMVRTAAEAVSWSTREEAELWRQELEDFAEAWAVTSYTPEPREAP